jgi:hypothetical protein
MQFSSLLNLMLVQKLHLHAGEASSDNDDLVSSTAKRRKKGAASFIMNVGATVESKDDGGDFSIRASVSMELSLFQKEKGCLLCNDDGNHLCPLE